MIAIADVGEIPLMAVEFFALFSRLEFALLASGYSGGEEGENAWVIWDSFAQDLHSSFFREARDDPSLSILFEEPARKLVRHANGGCVFQDCAAPKDAAELIVQVRRIRNNLFHGSKVNFQERDSQLVHAAIGVLRQLLDALDKDRKTWKVRAAWGYADVGNQ
ncbi:hypothetical protein JOH50_004730 [Rhizobium leguminosarum]|uniref:hypothetical protein n=1 Tax=Rhizobium leguminosarum TaxID=384 RepID=UPI001AE440AB|nr:hypothetical protein [Rhizobium leguminosarum]MBP2489003.1 hypothetical protein [Rhizobium leguminosarum]